MADKMEKIAAEGMTNEPANNENSITADALKDNIAERRRLTRVEMISQAFCLKKMLKGEMKEYDPPVEIALLNISENGLCIRSAETFEQGSFISLEIEIEGEIYSGINGKVLWEIPESDGSQYGLLVNNMSGRLFSHAFRLNTGISHQA